MNENKLFTLVGDDDSGPEDVEDDLDLECETAILTLQSILPSRSLPKLGTIPTSGFFMVKCE